MVFWERLDIGQKTGLLAAAAVFVAAQITLTLTLASKAHLEEETRALHAEALLNAVASRTAGLFASDDMLTATSELNTLLSSDVVSGAAIPPEIMTVLTPRARKVVISSRAPSV